MWLFVFFDLPVKTREEKRKAAKFRKFLLGDGYTMIQWSVYARVCNGQDSVDKHHMRLEAALPPKGNVRAMQVTDQQYGRIALLVGKKSSKEAGATPKQLTFF